MDSNFYRVCVDRYINENFIVTDCLCNLLSNVNKARCEMIKCVDDVISIKAFKLEFEEFNDDSIGVFSVDGNKFKHYSLICYITTVTKSDNKYRYRDFEIFKNQDKWFIRSDKSGVISYKSNLEEALIYIDCIIAIMKNIEIANTIADCDINNENIISEYDDFVIFKNNDKYYYKESNSKEVKEVVLVRCILLEVGKNISDDELLNPGFDFDVSGKLFNNQYYCYWKFL